MCGIAGWLGRSSSAESADAAYRVLESLKHRGPDDHGIWRDEEAGVVLTHRRLSILDLSQAGHQPMLSSCGRYVLAFNGEIYNHLELQEKLEASGEAPKWRGHSDSETLLAALATWGIEQALKATVGMFAFAVWDRRERILTLARDRAGEKPLYYGWQKDTFFFASELKALKAHPSFQPGVNREALALFLRHSCVPAPYSIYLGIQKLMPGHYVEISPPPRRPCSDPKPKPYYELNTVISTGRANPFRGSVHQAIASLNVQLTTAIESQMLSDAPIGALLSGGIDSSAIVAIMQSLSEIPIRTFTVGFSDKRYNEAEQAKEVAQHLGTCHTELYVSPKDALAVIPKLASIYCEPFGDSSQIPTYLVSALASRHVKVALSGDAGDEIFGGYNRYLLAATTWNWARRLPNPFRQAASRLLTSRSPLQWDGIASAVDPFLPRRLRLRTPGEKAHKLSSALLAEDGASFYTDLISAWKNPSAVVIGAHEPKTLISHPQSWPPSENFIEWMMAMDARTYMHDDILTKVDRAAMANSLETRTPFLDHRVIEFAWRLPLSMKIRKGKGKWLLRQLLYQHVPQALIDRPKMGFAVPLSDWLRGPLREWAEDLLDPQRLRSEGYFEPTTIRKTWESLCSGESNDQHALWNILMFQAWLSENGG